MDERKFHQEIPVTPIFNVKVYFSYTSPLCSLCHGTSHVIGNCFYRTSQILATNLKPSFVPNFSPVLFQITSKIIVPPIPMGSLSIVIIEFTSSIYL